MRRRRWGAIVSSEAEAGVADSRAQPAPGLGWAREFWPTILATAILLYAARPGAGILLPLWLPVLLVWFPRMAWIAWRRPARRRAQGIKAMAIVAAIAIAGFAHGRYESRSRAQAQNVVDAVTAYRARHGAYPDNLAPLGLDEQALRRDWEVRYLNNDGRQRVFYAAEFSVFDSWEYDFAKPGWVYKPGD